MTGQTQAWSVANLFGTVVTTSIQMRILLVEDEPRAAQVLAKGLREEAYAVDIAPDGERAVYRPPFRSSTRSFSISAFRGRTASPSAASCARRDWRSRS